MYADLVNCSMESFGTNVCKTPICNSPQPQKTGSFDSGGYIKCTPKYRMVGDEGGCQFFWGMES